MADVAILAAMLAGGVLLGVLLVDAVRPERVGDPMFWVSAAVFLVLVPLAATHWMIGWVIYLNHTHPDIVWYDDPAEWSRRRVQLEGSADPRFAGWGQSLLPRRIMNHAAHHLDPGVPLRRLREAQRRLADTVGDRFVSYPWSASTRREILTRCKLYDYDARCWLTYAAAEERR